jgi:Ser/Thr protein kinase RdoA (MazF antagonist)
MLTFPVSNSTLSSEHLASYLAQEYHFDLPVQCKLLKTGISHTYLLSTESQKFIFRLYSFNWRTETEIQEEIRLINFLKENNVPVSYAIADPSGNYIKKLNAPEGIRFGVLFSHAKGAKAINFSEEIHFKMGETMAKMHQLTENFHLDRVTYTPEMLLDQSFERLKSFLNPEQEEMVYMAEIKKTIKYYLQNTDVSNIRSGAVHSDIWFDNMHITDQGEITIFDFDFCGNGFLCQDLGYYIAQLYHLEKDENEFSSKLHSFISGYESVNKINDQEKEMIPYLGTAVYFFFLGVQCQRYDNWSNVFVNEIYLSRFISVIVKRWCDYNKLFIETNQARS